MPAAGRLGRLASAGISRCIFLRRRRGSRIEFAVMAYPGMAGFALALFFLLLGREVQRKGVLFHHGYRFADQFLDVAQVFVFFRLAEGKRHSAVTRTARTTDAVY